jgi:hypothetical protein
MNFAFLNVQLLSSLIYLLPLLLYQSQVDAKIGLSHSSTLFTETEV